MKNTNNVLLGFLLLIMGFSTLFSQDWDQCFRAIGDFSGDRFGWSVAISDEYAVVGAIYHDYDTSGSNEIPEAGSAYIYQNNNGSWEFYQKVVHSDREWNDGFGSSVAISGDIIVIGAEGKFEDFGNGNIMYSAGAVYIFKNNLGVWEQVQKLNASDREDDSYFGNSLSISGDYLVVGSERKDTGGKDKAGSVYIFKYSAGSWTEIQKITAPDPEAHAYFGSRVSISGEYAFVGSGSSYQDTTSNNYLAYAGAAYIYLYSAGTWELIQKITPSDRAENDFFSRSLAVYDDYAIVGAASQDYDDEGNNYLNSSGAAYIFKNNKGTWSEIQKIVAQDRKENDSFGSFVDMYENYALIGVPFKGENGASYMFKNTGDNWSQEQKIVVSDGAIDDEFGSDVTIYKNYCIIGAKNKNTNNLRTGAAYVFRNDAILLSLNLNYSQTLKKCEEFPS